MSNIKEESVIQVVNMRGFFVREKFMYSLGGDWRFSSPIALKQAAYTMAFLVLWSLPIVVFFGLRFDFFFAAITFGPPIVLGKFANKQIWGGRTLIDFIRVSFSFVGQPKGWTDHNANNGLGKEVFKIDNDIWVSRRRELRLLAEYKERKEKGLSVDNIFFNLEDDLPDD